MNIEVTRDGKRDLKRMITYRLKSVALQYGNKVDYWFVNGNWPKELV